MTTTQAPPKPTTIPRDIHDVPKFRAVVDKLSDCKTDIADVNRRLADAMFQPEGYASPIEREAEARLRGEQYNPEGAIETQNQLYHERDVLRKMQEQLERDVRATQYEVADDYEELFTARMTTSARAVNAAARKLQEAMKSLNSLQVSIYDSNVPYFGNGHDRIAIPTDAIERLISESGEYQGTNNE